MHGTHRRFWIVCITGLLFLATAPAKGAEKRYFGPCPEFSPGMKFECYHSYEEVVAFLRAAHRQYPQWTRLESIGKSYQGRDLWVMTITDFSTGEPETKPAVWVDGGIDADEVIGIEVALGLIHRLLTSRDPELVELRRNRTFYIAPAVIPDASELHMTTPIRPRDTTLRPWDDDHDGAFDEDGPEDLDGDGEALMMRVPDPNGASVAHEKDARLLRRRRPGDTGPFYQVYSEGIDNDDDGAYNEDPVGGVDPNRNYPAFWSPQQQGSGPFAVSERELRAMMDFIQAHPNIAASHHFHSSGGVILRPPTVPQLKMPEPDLTLYLDLARRGVEITGYHLATSVIDWNWPRGTRNRKHGQIWRDAEGRIHGWPEEVGPLLAGFDHSDYPAYGSSLDTLYALFGAVAFANEIYPMGKDENGDGRVDNLERLHYNDKVLKGKAFKEWTRFEHPQLGRVEIGGWRKFGWNNPLPPQLAEEIRRNVDFVLMQARHTPQLELETKVVQRVGTGLYRIEVAVKNTGRQPTELAIRVEQKRATPVQVRLQGADAVHPKAEQKLEVIPGYHEKRLAWWVRARAGTVLTVTAQHPKSGRTRLSIRLP